MNKNWERRYEEGNYKSKNRREQYWSPWWMVLALPLTVCSAIIIWRITEALTPGDWRLLLGVVGTVILVVITTACWCAVTGISGWIRMRMERADDVGEIMRQNRVTSPVHISFDQQGQGHMLNPYSQIPTASPSLQTPMIDYKNTEEILS